MSDDATPRSPRILDAVDVVGPGAEAYLAYASLEQDLLLALDLLDRLEGHPGPVEGDNDFHRMALWIAITTTYGRCFGPGRRAYFAATFVPQYHDLGRLHRWVLAHRNQTIAHLDPTSEGETARAFVGIDGDEVVTIEHRGERWLMPDHATLRRLRRLLRYVELKAEQRRNNAGRKILDVIRAKSPYALRTAIAKGRPLHVARPPDTAEESRSRARPPGKSAKP